MLSFDIISDLNLTNYDQFDWTDKPTGLFCLLAGNISNNIFVLQRTLRHLSTLYHGVFFIDGVLENLEIENRDNRVNELSKMCVEIPKVVYLHNNVVVLEGVAILAINGWYKNHTDHNTISSDFQIKSHRYEDLAYLEKTLEKLQLHVDVKKIILMSSCVPSENLYFGESPKVNDDIPPNHLLYKDTEHKVKTWVFGGHNKLVDQVENNIRYLNNPCDNKNLYYPKRIEI
jgi:predicted phosphohydrolase